ncbi:protein WVD2-like 7 [Forsythia ovata]|uniref:Protein WVD2-like 7 n=1 Tax=Forsythia ovata TaxID=205694 RepID=A0ABD1XDZ2_9LAMI
MHREAIKASSPGPKKIVNSRLISTHSNKSKDSVVPPTSTRASSMNSMVKHPAITPRPDKRYLTFQVLQKFCGVLISQNNKQYPKKRINSILYETMLQLSKILPAHVKAKHSLLLCLLLSSSKVKNEQQNVKRQVKNSQEFYVLSLSNDFFEKLEKKKNAQETEKQQLQTKSKEKPKIDFRDLRHSIAFKVGPNGKVSGKTESPNILMKKEKPNIDSRHFRHSIAFKVSPNGKVSGKTESPNSLMKKIPKIQPCDPELKGKAAFKVQDKESTSNMEVFGEDRRL